VNDNQVLGINGDMIDFEALQRAEEEFDNPSSKQGDVQSQPNASAEPPATDMVANDDQAQAQSQSEPKFEGKSREEILEMYQNLQKDYGRLGSEVGQQRKEKETLEERLRTYQGQPHPYQVNPPHPYAATPQPVAAAPAEDYIEKVKARWEEGDQLGAMVDLVKNQEDKRRREQIQEVISHRTQRAAAFVNERSKDQDFVRRLPTMQTMAVQFNDLIKPEYASSPEVLHILDLASKGADVEHYVKAGLDKAQQAKQQITNEKRSAGGSERPVGTGGSAVTDPWGEDMKTLEKRLGRIDR
jgi:hypothetical protein